MYDYELIAGETVNEKDKQQLENNTDHVGCEICKMHQQPELGGLYEEKPEYGDNIPLRKGYDNMAYILNYSVELKKNSKSITSIYSVRNNGTVVVKHKYHNENNQLAAKTCIRYLTLEKAQEIQQSYILDAQHEEDSRKLDKLLHESERIIFKNSSTSTAMCSSKREKNNGNSSRQCKKPSMRLKALDRDTFVTTELPSPILSTKSHKSTMTSLLSQHCVII